MLRSLMGRLTSTQKEEVQARVESFDFSGFEKNNLCRHFRSFVGRDFKVIAQCALFLLGSYMTPAEKQVWLSLSKVYDLLVQPCIVSVMSFHITDIPNYILSII